MANIYFQTQPGDTSESNIKKKKKKDFLNSLITKE